MSMSDLLPGVMALILASRLEMQPLCQEIP